jgi:ribosomal protein S26
LSKRKVPPPCEHHYDDLTIMLGGATRGAAQTVRVSCQVCGKLLPQKEGIIRFVLGMRDNMHALRRAVINLGGELVDPAMGSAGAKGKRKANLKESCPHYLGWLSVASDRSTSRGYQGGSTVRCRNCQKTWGDHTALLMKMREEIEALWLEVRRLGGKRTTA